MARILAFGSDRLGLMLVRRSLARGGHEVFCSTSPQKFVEMIGRVSPDLVFTEEMMVGMSGMLMHRTIRKMLGPELAVLVSTDRKLRDEGSDPRLGFCYKPVDQREILDAVRRLLVSPVFYEAPRARAGALTQTRCLP